MNDKYTYLFEVSGGNPELIKDLIDTFEKTVINLKQKIISDFDNNNFKNLPSYFHQLKSNVAVFDMHKWVEKFKDLEDTQIENYKNINIKKLLEEFTGEYKKVITEVKEIINKI